MDSFLFESGIAEELYDEALVLEEEHDKKMKAHAESRKNLRLSMLTGNTMFTSSSLENDDKKPTPEDSCFDDMESSAGSADMDNQVRQREVFRAAVNRKEDNNFIFSFLTSLGVVGIVFIIVVLSLGLVITAKNSSSIDTVEKTCSGSSGKWCHVTN